MSEKFERAVLQHVDELRDFIALVKHENVRSYLEIGSKHGGSLWHIGSALPQGARIVSVDLPYGDTSFKESQPHLEACIRTLSQRGYDAHLFIGDSTDSKIVEAVRALAPFDLVFIDANHTEPYVRKDWANYGPLGRIVAFHDISHVHLPHKPSKKMPIEVPKVWAELRQQFRNVEFRRDPHYNGIGVLWR